MPEIAFPLSTAPGIHATESGGRLINAYTDLMADGARSKTARRRCPGLRPAFTLSDDTFRGAVLVDTQLYVANGDKVDLVTKSGDTYTVTPQSGTLPGTGRVFMARNQNATPQILIVHSAGMSEISSGTVSDFSDADLPAANSISFMDSYFFPTIGDGRAFASGINAKTFAATDFTRAEASPDSLLRSIPAGRDLLLMGSASIEVWTNTANTTGFPFSRAAVLKHGLWGIYAVAGWEEGFPDTIMFVAADNTVRRIVGYDAEKISQPDLEKLIAAIDDHTDIEASVYVDRGRPVFVISSSTWTWEYNVSTGLWNERASLGKTRWRAHGGIKAFNEWLVFDTESTDAYRIDASFARENADQLVFEVRSTQQHRFPGRYRVKRASFDFKVGVGIDAGIDPIETKPKVQISWSDDGGVTFSSPVLRSLGRQGQIVPIDVFNAGSTRQFGRQWRLVVADPVDVALYGGADDIGELAA